MDDPFFSIITPTYNCGDKIGPTARSVFQQTGVTYEYLVIDGSSTDYTLKALREESAKAGVTQRLTIISEHDRGLYDAMNKGAAAAKGKFLYFLGAGDRLRADVLSVVQRVCGSEDADDLLLVYGNVSWPGLSDSYAGQFSRFKLAKQNICHQAIFYDRRIFKEMAPYNLKYEMCADYDLNLRCFGSPRIRTIYTDLIVADFEPGGRAMSNRDRRFYKDLPVLIRKHLGLVPYLCLWFRRPFQIIHGGWRKLGRKVGST